LTVEAKRKYPSEALWSRFSYGEITYEEFEQAARSEGVSETVLSALLSVHHGNGPPTSREEYEMAVHDPFADVWIGKDAIQVTRWYDLESKPVHPKDAKTKAAFGDARLFAATADHKEVGSATCRGPFFDEFCKLMYSRRHMQPSTASAEMKAAGDAQYAFQSTVGEARYDTNEELRDAWQRYMAAQGLALPPEEARKRFIEAHAMWKTRGLDALEAAEAGFFHTYEGTFRL
jgi:hypothetical protein